jgi:hypothetical protein
MRTDKTFQRHLAEHVDAVIVGVMLMLALVFAGLGFLFAELYH